MVLQATLTFNWTGPFNILAVGAASATALPDDSPVAAKFLLLDPLAIVPAPRRSAVSPLPAVKSGATVTMLATCRNILPPH